MIALSIEQQKFLMVFYKELAGSNPATTKIHYTKETLKTVQKIIESGTYKEADRNWLNSLGNMYIFDLNGKEYKNG